MYCNKTKQEYAQVKTQDRAWTLKPVIGYPVRYSEQILVFEFSYLQSYYIGAVNPSDVLKNVWNQNLLINHYFCFILKKGV